MYLRRRSPYGLWERWFATFVLLTFLYGVGGCAPWGPSLLRSQARFALPPAPTPAYVLAARFRLDGVMPVMRVKVRWRDGYRSRINDLLRRRERFPLSACRRASLITAAQHVRRGGGGREVAPG